MVVRMMVNFAEGQPSEQNGNESDDQWRNRERRPNQYRESGRDTGLDAEQRKRELDHRLEDAQIARSRWDDRANRFNDENDRSRPK